jgi:hypothetical protein
LPYSLCAGRKSKTPTIQKKTKEWRTASFEIFEQLDITSESLEKHGYHVLNEGYIIILYQNGSTRCRVALKVKNPEVYGKLGKI